jgi:hypothetical protein
MPTEQTIDHISVRRPVWVWVIIVFYTFTIVVSLPSLIAATTGALQMSGPAAAHYQSMGASGYLRLGLSLTLMVLVVVSLFRMRRSALYFAIAAILYGQIVWLWQFAQMKSMGLGLGRMAFNAIVGAAIALYLWHLTRRGLLR